MEQLFFNDAKFSQSRFGKGITGKMPSRVQTTHDSSDFPQTRFVLRESWNTKYARQLLFNKPAITPFRAVTNSGDLLSRKNYSCGGSNQVAQSKPGIKGMMGHILSNCDGTGVAPSSCNVKYVYDSSDYTRFLKQREMNVNYNDLTFGGNNTPILPDFKWYAFYNESLQQTFWDTESLTPEELVNGTGPTDRSVNDTDIALMRAFGVSEDEIQSQLMLRVTAVETGPNTGIIDAYKNASPAEKKRIEQLKMIDASYMSLDDAEKYMAPFGYKLLRNRSTEETKVFMKEYPMKVNNIEFMSKQVTVAARGTVNLGDAWTDVYAIILGLKFLSPRFNDIKTLTTELQIEYGPTNVNAVGHSLGGTLAQYADPAGNIVTFNKGSGILAFIDRTPTNEKDYRTRMDIASITSYIQRGESTPVIIPKTVDTAVSPLYPVNYLIDSHLMSNMKTYIQAQEAGQGTQIIGPVLPK